MSPAEYQSIPYREFTREFNAALRHKDKALSLIEKGEETEESQKEFWLFIMLLMAAVRKQILISVIAGVISSLVINKKIKKFPKSVRGMMAFRDTAISIVPELVNTVSNRAAYHNMALTKATKDFEYLVRSIMAKRLDNYAKIVLDDLRGNRILMVNGRKMQAKSHYATIFKTEFTDAMNKATVKTIIKDGTELVKISAHQSLTRFDRQFENRVYSLENGSIFPKLHFMPPFHPNCWHFLRPFSIENKTSSEIQDLVAFSNRPLDRALSLKYARVSAIWHG